MLTDATLPGPSNSTFSIMLGCGKYLSYSDECDQDQPESEVVDAGQ